MATVREDAIAAYDKQTSDYETSVEKGVTDLRDLATKALCALLARDVKPAYTYDVAVVEDLSFVYADDPDLPGTVALYLITGYCPVRGSRALTDKLTKIEQIGEALTNDTLPARCDKQDNAPKEV